MSAHTPGPWLVNGRAIEQDKEKRAQVIAYVDDEQNDDSRANARLIAAAPDLLMVAESVLLRGHVDPCRSMRPLRKDVDCDCLVRMARAAIAKARGGK